MLAGLFGAVRRPRPGSAMGTAREPGGAPTPHARDRPLATTFASRRDRSPAPVEETALAATGTRQSTTSRRSKTGTALDASASLFHIHAQKASHLFAVTSRRVASGGCGLMLASSRHAAFSPRGRAHAGSARRQLLVATRSHRPPTPGCGERGSMDGDEPGTADEPASRADGFLCARRRWVCAGRWTSQGCGGHRRLTPAGASERRPGPPV